MPVEIGTSGGLTFRVTDSDNNVKFDINRKKAKIVETHFISDLYGDADVNVIQHRVPTLHGTTYQYYTSVVANHVEAKYYYHNINPNDGFILAFIMFPDSGSQDNSNIVYATSGNPTYNATINREAMFIHPLGKWIPANGGKIIRHYFTQNNSGFRGWSGTQLFFYNWTDNPLYNPFSANHPYNKKYRIVTGLVTQCTSLAGSRSTGGGYNINVDGSPPAVFNMSGIGYNDIGTGTGKMKSTRCYMQTRIFICK